MACQEFRKEVDAVFPEHLSRLHRGTNDNSSYRRNQRKVMHREALTPGAVPRYRTQPVTFDEIKEVDEDVLNDENPEEESAAAIAQSEENLMHQKFQKQRLRRRGSYRSARRSRLRPSNSHEELECEFNSSEVQEQSAPDQHHALVDN